MKKATIFCFLSSIALTGCLSTTPTKETQVGYAIYKIKPAEGATATEISGALVTALQKNTNSVNVSRDIPPHPLPEQPGRFELVNPFANSNLGALAAASGNNLRTPTCEGAIVTAQATDTSMGNYGENTSFHTCLWQYKDGFHLDVYTRFTVASGSFNPATLGATLARTVVGDTSQFIPRTLDSIVKEIESTGANVSLVEAYP